VEIVTRKNASFILLGLALVALPFSMRICHLALILYLLLWVTEGKWAEKIALIRSNIVIQLVMAFSILHFVGLLYTDNSSDGWTAIERKIFLFVMPLAVATTFVRFEEKETHRLFYFFTTACIVGSFICLGSALHEFIQLRNGIVAPQQFNYLGSGVNPIPVTSAPWLVFSYVELANGISMHPTYLSFYLAFCIIFLFYRITATPTITPREKLLIKILIVYFTIFIVSLSSRMVILSMCVLYVGMLAGSMMKKRRATAALLFSLIVILGVTLYINPITRYRNLEEVARSSYNIQPNTTYSNSTEIRASLWWLSLQSFATVNPFFGTGTGDVDDLMHSISDHYEIKNTLDNYNPHNEFFYILLGNGLITLVVFGFILAIPFRKAWIDRDYLFLGFLFLFISLCLTETILERQKGAVFFALIFPLLNFQRHPERQIISDV
jgi:O-antigen ligase